MSDFWEEYRDFVKSVTSKASEDDAVFEQKCAELSRDLKGNFARLDTAIAGIAGESGEISDVWKKIKFHHKSFAEKKDDLISELGDIYWYLAQASIALGITPQELMKNNMEKLKLRHPAGHFSNQYMKK